MNQTAFDFERPVYPVVPGAKERGGTSQLAAEEIAPLAGRLRAAVLSILERRGPATPDEIADELDESPLSIRPRVTELIRLGLVRKTEERRRNASGKAATVVELVRRDDGTP